VTIIARVVDALRKSDNASLADELTKTIGGMRDNIEQLLTSVHRQGEIARMLVNLVQARCRHQWWYLVSTNVESNPATWGPEDVVACTECGHTVCDERAYNHGKRLTQGHGSGFYTHTNGRWFMLDTSVKRHLGDKLTVKELISDGDKEALRVVGHSASKGSTSGLITPSGSGDGSDGRPVGA
jgi:hypothetical protein